MYVSVKCICCNYLAAALDWMKEHDFYNMGSWCEDSRLGEGKRTKGTKGGNGGWPRIAGGRYSYAK